MHAKPASQRFAPLRQRRFRWPYSETPARLVVIRSAPLQMSPPPRSRYLTSLVQAIKALIRPLVIIHLRYARLARARTKFVVRRASISAGEIVTSTEKSCDSPSDVERSQSPPERDRGSSSSGHGVALRAREPRRFERSVRGPCTPRRGGQFAAHRSARRPSEGLDLRST